MTKNSSELEAKLILSLQSQIPGLVKNIVSYVQNPSGDNDSSKSLLENDKIKNEFFKAEQHKPFQQIIEKMLLHALFVNSDNPLQSQYQFGADEAQKIHDNWEGKTEIFRAACNPVFEVESSNAEEVRYEKVIKVMLEKISASPEKQITNAEEYQEFRERLLKTHDLTNLPDRELKEEDKKIKREGKVRLSHFKKPKSPDSKFQSEEELEAEIEAILRSEKQYMRAKA